VILNEPAATRKALSLSARNGARLCTIAEMSAKKKKKIRGTIRNMLKYIAISMDIPVISKIYVSVLESTNPIIRMSRFVIRQRK
jgi:hypothetical protein